MGIGSYTGIHTPQKSFCQKCPSTEFAPALTFLLGLALLLVQQLLMFSALYGKEGALTLAHAWACKFQVCYNIWKAQPLHELEFVIGVCTAPAHAQPSDTQPASYFTSAKSHNAQGAPSRECLYPWFGNGEPEPALGKRSHQPPALIRANCQGAQLVSRASSAQPAHADWSSSPVLRGAQQAPRRTLRGEPAGVRALSWWACSTGSRDLSRHTSTLASV